MATPREIRDFFAEVFAALDAEPKERVVKFPEGGFAIDLLDGEPLFLVPGEEPALADFRGRWLAEHPVPLEVTPGMRITFVPATGNRVKVR